MCGIVFALSAAGTALDPAFFESLVESNKARGRFLPLPPLDAPDASHNSVLRP
jgi:hypothetical protein